jgi:hypothetical protein
LKKQKKSILVLAAMVAFLGLGLFLPGMISAGDLEPTAGPDVPGSAMYTLEDIYNRLNDNTTATKRAGGFTEPSAAPGPTGHTLDQIYELALPTRVEKTGAGQTGWGVTWPVPRFTDNSDGTVTDNLTGLVWLKNANCDGTKIWADALTYCNGLANGSCGLTDGSSAGDWRLPNVKELQSLIDFGEYLPPLTSGHPFTGVQSADHWSSTPYEGGSTYAWGVSMGNGDVSYISKTTNESVWPVRGGN